MCCPVPADPRLRQDTAAQQSKEACHDLMACPLIPLFCRSAASPVNPTSSGSQIPPGLLINILVPEQLPPVLIRQIGQPSVPSLFVRHPSPVLSVSCPSILPDIFYFYKYFLLFQMPSIPTDAFYPFGCFLFLRMPSGPTNAFHSFGCLPALQMPFIPPDAFCSLQALPPPPPLASPAMLPSL